MEEKNKHVFFSIMFISFLIVTLPVFYLISIGKIGTPTAEYQSHFQFFWLSCYMIGLYLIRDDISIINLIGMLAFAPLYTFYYILLWVYFYFKHSSSLKAS